MKRKVILLAAILALVLGFSLVTSLSAGATGGSTTLEVNGPLVQATSDGGHYMGSYSPDGRRIVFTGSGGIYIANADGSNPLLIHDSGTRPKWGPSIDGYPEGLIALAGTGITLITPEGNLVTTIDTSHIYPGDGQTKAGTHSLDWSPDGVKIAFADNSGTMGIWFINLDGTGLTQITDYSKTAYAPAWSLDGTEIACAWGPSSDMHVGVFAADGTGLIREIGNGGDYPDWGSSDEIAYNDSLGALHVINSDGTDDKVVSAGPVAMVAWSPDSKRLAYINGFSEKNIFSRGYPYTNIQSAVDAAACGDTIEVAAGTYDENVAINRELTLKARIGESPVINAGGTPEGSQVIGINITANNITVDGLTVINARGEWSAGIAVSGNIRGLTIQNCIIHNANNGISLYETGDGATNLISGNTVYDIHNDYSPAGNAIVVWGDSAPCNSTTITNNEIYGTERWAIALGSDTTDPCINNTISGNNIHDNDLDSSIGIGLVNASDNFVTNNNISGCQQGIGLNIYSSNNLFEGNNVSSNSLGVSLWYASDSNTLKDNIISSNTWQGVLIDNSSGNILTGNTMENNQHGISLDHNSVNNNITCNIVSNNQIGVSFYTASNGNILEDNTVSSNVWQGMLIDNSSHNLLSGNTITDNWVGIWLCNASNDNIVESNTVSSSTNMNIYVDASTGIAITSNTISSGAWAGIQFLNGATGEVHCNSIVDNAVAGLVNDAVTEVDATGNWWGSASAADVSGNVSFNVDYSPWWGANYVGDDHSSPWTWYTDDSIQDVITIATEYDTINVAAGTYDEQVVITESLTLVGAGECTVIQPSSADKLASLYTLGTQEGAYWNGHKLASIIEVSGAGAAGVTIKDLQVDGANINSKPAGANYIVGISYGESAGCIEYVSVINMNTNPVTENDRTYGIWLDAVATTVSVEVKDCDINLYNKNGINARGAELTINIHNNTVTGPGDSPCVPNGILLINGASGTVGPDNTITNHQYSPELWTACGIATWEVDEVIIEGNNISNCDSGIGLSGYPGISGTTNTIVRKNTITETTRGIFLECPASTNNIIAGNDILENDYGIYLEGESPYEAGADNEAHFNNITNNTYGVSNFNPAVVFNATNNWWGTKDRTSIASMVSGNVTYEPWTGAGTTDTKSEKTGTGDATIDAKTEASTEVEKKGTGTPTISVAKYESNPGTGFSGDTGTYVDVHVDDPTDVEEIVINVYYTSADIAGLNEATLRLRWWNGTAWQDCSDSGVNATDIAGPPAYSGYMWAKIRTDTTPSLDDLSGTAFTGIGKPPEPPATGGGGGAGPSTATGTTNIRGKVSSTGRFVETIIATTADKMCSLTIPVNTIGLDKDLKSLTKITMLATSLPQSLPENWNIIGLPYDFSPSGTTFDPAITLTWKYKAVDLPANAAEEDLKLAYYDAAGKWVVLDCVVDSVNNVITAKLTHFTAFALVEIPKAAAFTIGSLVISPAEVITGETITASITVTNTGNIEGSYLVTLKVNSVKEAEKTVTIAAGSSQDVSFNIVKETAGTYTVDLNGLKGSFTVTPKPVIEPTKAAEPEPEPEPEFVEPEKPALTPAPSVTTPIPTQVPEKKTNWGIIGGVVAAGVVIIVISVLFLRRRKV